MKGLYLIKILSRLSFIYAVISFLIGNIEYRDAGAMAFIWQVLVTYLIFKNRERGLKYILMILVFAPLIKIHGISLFISVAVIGTYSIYYSIKELGPISYGAEVDEFQKSGVVLWILFGLSILFLSVGELGQASGYYIIIYLSASIILLRLLRNIDFNKGNKSVERINFIYSIVLTLFTFTISISYIRNGIVKIIRTIYNTITDLFMYVFSWFFLGAGFVMQRIYNYLMYLMGKKPVNGIEVIVDSRGDLKLNEDMRKSLLEAVYENTFLNTTLRVVVIALVVYIIIRMFRRANRVRVINEEDYEETKEFIGTKDFNMNSIIKKVSALIKPSTNYEKIRFYYRMFLKKCIDNGISIEKSDTTLDIADKTSHKFNKMSLREMREIYVKVRYSDKDAATKELLQRFIMYYRNIKNQ